jgi:hypothetical protein
MLPQNDEQTCIRTGVVFWGMAGPTGGQIPEWFGMMLTLWQGWIPDSLLAGVCLDKQLRYAGR